MLQRLFFTLLICSTLLTTAQAANSATKATQPNVVFILIDDMGWKDLGCFDAKLYETPHIDALCKEGMRFTQAYTSTAICSPARATALTGKHPMKMRMWNHQHYIPVGQKILPAYLKEKGYQNWHVGKWHLGSKKAKTYPTDIGFDVNRGGCEAWGPGSYFWPYNCKKSVDQDGNEVWQGILRNSVPGMAAGGKEGEYLTDRLAEEAVKLIKNRDKNKPFYLNFWHYAVHNKKEAKAELVEKYEKKIEKLGIEPSFRLDKPTGSKLVASETNAVYAAMLESLDDAVGQVVELLKKEGEYDNTLFIFFSDNGSTTDSVPCVPLNGGKNSTYEGGVRVPAFVTWKGHVKPETTYNRPVYLGDVFNTVLDATGCKLPKNYDGDGLSWLPLFEGKELPKRKFVWYFPDTRRKWAQRANVAIYDEESGLKFLLYLDGSPDELYDIDADLPEAKNILKEKPEAAAALKKELITYLKKYYPAMPKAPKQYAKVLERRLKSGE